MTNKNRTNTVKPKTVQPETPGTPEVNQPETPDNEATTVAARTVNISNLTPAYYGIERQKKEGQKTGEVIFLAPYFEGQGHELLDENEAFKSINIPEDEWEWIQKTQPKIARDSVADIQNGQRAKLRVIFR